MSLLSRFKAFFRDSDPDEPVYDPVHVGAMVMIVLVGITVLFWLLWALLVCQGGIAPKLSALAQIAFTRKTFADFGWEGYPYALGVFEGFVVNFGALLLLFLVLFGIWWVFRPPRPSHDGR